ncbi:unnamed protein product [Rotaria socialis]
MTTNADIARIIANESTIYRIVFKKMKSHGSSYDDSSIIDSEYETELDSDLDCFTADNNDGTLLYQDGSISLYQAYKAIKKCIIKFLKQFAKTSQRYAWTSRSTCNFYGKQRTNDSVTEVAEANIVDRIKNVVKRNLPLIIEYQQRAHLLLPNDTVNSVAYQQIHKDSIFNHLTLTIHADGIQLVTTKRKMFYAVTNNFLEIPPPHREYIRNELLFVLYFCENEPTPSILYDNLC